MSISDILFFVKLPFMELYCRIWHGRSYLSQLNLEIDQLLDEFEKEISEE